jgi:hypothetical protein
VFFKILDAVFLDDIEKQVESAMNL